MVPQRTGDSVRRAVDKIMRDEQEPTLISSGHAALGDQYDHPAYGTISCGRVSGGVTTLVGSELVHNHYVRLTIQKAKKSRSLHEDRFFAEMRPLVEINLSEHQWASFVASMNIGNGVPCTIAYGPAEGSVIEPKPRLKEPNKHETAQKELLESANELTESLIQQISALTELADAPGAVSKTALREHLKAIQGVVTGICHNLPFHVRQHKEMMEKNVQAAKSDVEGFVTGMVQQLGLETLRNSAPSLPMLPSTGSKDLLE